MCAGVGAGVYEDLSAAAKALGRIAQQHQPGEARKVYTGLYADWLVLRQERSNVDEMEANQFVEVISSQQAAAGASGAIQFRPRIYISADMDETALKRLRELGEVTYASYREGKMLVAEELVETLAGYHVFVTEVDIVSAEDLQKLPDLRMVAVCRGNPVNVDIPACSAAGIPVVNTPARNADAVADLAIGYMLMLVRKLPGAMAFMTAPGGEAGDMGRMGMAHEQFLGTELWRKTVGVIGGGAIGRKVIQRLLPFEARTLLYDPYVDESQAVLMGAEKVTLERLLKESDIVTLHAPVTEETREMINAAAFEKMKPGAFLINTARAALVDNEALLEALRSGKLGGAGIDVFPVEPPAADDPLLALPNVVATPHVGGNTLEVAAHQGAIVADELQALLSGRKPQYLLNEGVLKDFAWTGERKVALAELKKLAAAPGPGVSDLDLGVAQQKTGEAAPEKKGGLLSALKKALGGEKAAEKAPETTVESAPVAAAAQAGGGPVREKMVRILEAFTANVRADASMAEFAQGKNVTFLFTVKDMDQEFFLSFADGKVGAGLGQPSGEPDVRLKMSADMLDGMFTGRVNAMKAAMGGKLSFSGDTGKAMAFQRIQKDMGRLYSAAREKIGDPGDLLSLGAAAVPAVAVPATAAPVASVSQGSGGVREKMVRILDVFTANVRSDAGMAEFAQGKNVTFLFTVKDMDQSFFLSFIEGKVGAGLGLPPQEPDVRLKMSADILDGMFTERINAMKAAMGGKLSFSGDTGKAMTFQRIQRDMGRLYIAAREKIGDPGDLLNLGAVPVVPAVAASVVAAAQPGVVVPAVIKTGDVRDQILMVTNELYAKGLITPTGGNVSARCDDNPNHIWITPSAIFKGDLRPDMMVRIDLDGKVVGETEYSASSERRVHCAIYKVRPDIEAVVHSHAQYATLMAMTGIKFLPISTEAAFFGDIPVVPFIMPGTNELGDRVAQAMGAGIAAIMQNHGLVVAGSSLRRAADMTDVIEVTAHKIITCRMLGIEPPSLPVEVVKQLREVGSMMA
jgi:L-ribulose-5-phosphate 4-epimerase